MKILHIAKYYEPIKGGIEKVTNELAVASVEAGHEVVVLSCNQDRRHLEENVEGVKVIRLPQLTEAFSQPLSFGMLWQAKKWLQWADVVHLHIPNPLAEIAFLLQDQNKPLIVTYHCDVVDRSVLRKAYEPLQEKILKRADKIVVSTPNHLEYCTALQDFQDKCEVIPFGVRAKHAEPNPEMNSHLKKIKDELGDYFLFVGCLHPYKGVDVLLHAMRQVNEKLVVLGNGPSWESWYLLAQDLGLQDQVRMIGRVDDDNEFAAYMHGCTGLVLPSINEAEAFGIVLIEAMSCSKPVITTKLYSGVPWVNDQGVTGLEVMPNDHQGLAKALNELSGQPEMREKMGAAARQRFEAHFTVDKMVQAYQGLYEQTAQPAKQAA